MSNGRSRSRPGIHAAIAAIAITAGLGIAGVASAAQDATIMASGDDIVWHPPEVTIQPGEMVTWTFDTDGMPHNVHSSSSNWDFHPSGDNPTTGSVEYTFETEGRYDFVCRFHGGMNGTVIVGDPPDPPDPDPDPSPSPSPSPSPQPSDPGGGTTPPPSPEGDTVKPTVRNVGLDGGRRAVKVRFRLSEPATVTIKVKRRGARKVLAQKVVQAPAGTRTITVRSKRLKKGRYTVEVAARDAYGNRSSVAKKNLTLRR